MEDAKLRELRRNEPKFKDLSQYFSVIKDIFGDCETVPFIRGFLHFRPEDWTVDSLTPQTQSDKITILNFLDRVDIVQKNPEKYLHGSSGGKHYEIQNPWISLGIEERTWQPDGTVIISTGFGLGGIEYGLDVCCGSKRDERGFSLNDLGYSSKSKIYLPVPHSILQNMGPNLETKFMFNNI